MEGTFTVEQAASIMNCDPRTIRNLIADGWLIGQRGKPNKAGSGQVTRKSLYQFLIVDHLSLYPNRVLKKMVQQKKFENNSGKSPNANRFNSIGVDTFNPSPYPLPQGEGEHNGEVDGALSPVSHSAGLRAPPTELKRCRHHDFVDQNHKFFRRRARQLAKDDPAFQDDLVQEMALAVLRYEKDAAPEFLFVLAENRAIDYIRYEIARGQLSLEEAQHATDKRAEQRASLEEFICELLQRGVPNEWIEEVIGWRLQAA